MGSRSLRTPRRGSFDFVCCRRALRKVNDRVYCVEGQLHDLRSHRPYRARSGGFFSGGFFLALACAIFAFAIRFRSSAHLIRSFAKRFVVKDRDE